MHWKRGREKKGEKEIIHLLIISDAKAADAAVVSVAFFYLFEKKNEMKFSLWLLFTSFFSVTMTKSELKHHRQEKMQKEKIKHETTTKIKAIFGFLVCFLYINK